MLKVLSKSLSVPDVAIKFVTVIELHRQVEGVVGGDVILRYKDSSTKFITLLADSSPEFTKFLESSGVYL